MCIAHGPSPVISKNKTKNVKNEKTLKNLIEVLCIGCNIKFVIIKRKKTKNKKLLKSELVLCILTGPQRRHAQACSVDADKGEN